jgi:hypothetical protein
VAKTIAVSVEKGTTRVFACSVDWPSWCRSGKDEEAALEALFASAGRYERIAGKLGFVAPHDRSEFKVTERHAGSATTDFGAPGVPAKSDLAALSDRELARLGTLLEAGWRAFDASVKAARGKALAKGPRGGGRSLDKIVDHVRDAEAGYLSGLGWPFKPDAKLGRDALLAATRRAALEGMAASAHGEIAAKGPRGGTRWKPRFFARRLGWHTVDHAWEIEDRVR